MSSSSDKPKRPILRIKREESGETSTAGRPRPSVRGRHKPADKSRKPLTAAPTRGTEQAPETPANTVQPARRRARPTPAPGPQEGRDPRPPARQSKPEHRGDRSPKTAAPRRPIASHTYFAACPRGLEEALSEELTGLGAQEPSPATGGVAFKGDVMMGWRANLWSRLAIRILRQVGHGRYRNEDDLYQAALSLPWPQWFAPDRSIAVHTVAHACPLKSLNFVTLRIKDGVCDRFRQENLPRPDVQARDPDVPILIYLERDRYTLYLDLSGPPLNRRGYRLHAAQAPLNENLAAGLLKLAGWTPDMPLLDPMMGGGTILLEAALIALDIAPGLKRQFAFENLSDFQPDSWRKMKSEAQARVLPKRELPLYGADIDPRMVRGAKMNFNAAGLGSCAALIEGDVLEIEPPEAQGLIISNPPYGVRLENEDMAGFYKGLGDTLKQRFSGWTAWFLSADPELPKGIGLRAARRVRLYNGPLECRFFEYQLITGSLRKPTKA